MNTDEYYMYLAIKLARKGNGSVSPNPMVGAVIVKNGRIIGQGYHKRYGGPHAEVNAIKNASDDLAGATIYVTLEPCCHTGKTPPCVESIIENKFRKVVVGTIDANPLVSRKGLDYLQSRGVEVTAGVLEEKCRSLNEVFFYYMETGMPFVTVKYAATLDGRIATASGQSQWISSPASLKFAHRLRARHDAVLVGAQTVIKDNPELTVRHIRGRNPLRVVVDSSLRVPLQAKIFQNLSAADTIIATTKPADDPQFQHFADSGVQLISTKADNEGKVDLKKLFKILAARGISSILIEGGAQIITAVLKENLASRLVAIIAPKIIGTGIEAVGKLDIIDLAHAKKLNFQKIKRIGPDIMIDSRLC